MARAAAAGSLPTDSPEERLRKSALVLSSLLITALACVWVATYAALGLWLSALIPLAYQAASLLGLALFARTKRYDLYRASQVFLILVLPFLLQWSLGGFVESSAVALWAFVAPLGALVFYGPRPAVGWFAGFAALVGVSAAIDPHLPAPDPPIPTWLVLTFFALNVLGPAVTTFALLEYFVRSRDRAYGLLAVEQERSERLLLSIFPPPIAERLKVSQGVIAERSDEVSVLFADITGFTPVAERLPPEDVVALLDEIFSAFDELVAEHGLEKIKTIGDGYMAAAGIPTPRRRPRRGGGPRRARHAGDAGRPPRRRRPQPARRHRLRPRRRGRDRPQQARLRPLGRHREHREPDGVARPARGDPGDRADAATARRRLRPRGAARRRGQGQGRDDDLPAGQLRVAEAADRVVVHEPGRLHEGVADGRPDEAEAAPLQLLAHRLRERRLGREARRGSSSRRRAARRRRSPRGGRRSRRAPPGPRARAARSRPSTRP